MHRLSCPRRLCEVRSAMRLATNMFIFIHFAPATPFFPSIFHHLFAFLYHLSPRPARPSSTVGASNSDWKEKKKREKEKEEKKKKWACTGFKKKRRKGRDMNNNISCPCPCCPYLKGTKQRDGCFQPHNMHWGNVIHFLLRRFLDLVRILKKE